MGPARWVRACLGPGRLFPVQLYHFVPGPSPKIVYVVHAYAYLYPNTYLGLGKSVPVPMVLPGGEVLGNGLLKTDSPS